MKKSIFAILLLIALMGCKSAEKQENDVASLPNAPAMVTAPAENSTNIPTIPPETAEVEASEPEINMEEIADQSFDIQLGSWGQVRYVSSKQLQADGRTSMKIQLKNGKGATVYTFPEPELTITWNLEKIEAVSFKDLNGDGQKDVIVLADYSTDQPAPEEKSFVPYIYFQLDDRFISDSDIDRNVYLSEKAKSVSDIVALLRQAPPKEIHQWVEPESEEDVNHEKMVRELCTKVVNSDLEEDQIISIYDDAYMKEQQITNVNNDEEMYYQIGACFEAGMNNRIKNDPDLQRETVSLKKTVTAIISSQLGLDYLISGGGSIWSDIEEYTLGIYGYRLNRYVMLKQAGSVSDSSDYESLWKELDANMKHLKQLINSDSDNYGGVQTADQQKQIDDNYARLTAELHQLKILTADKDQGDIFLLQEISKLVDGTAGLG
ncbi:hypothetical protein A8990_12361 [Paenibacillus taihuensis]|uniref:Uncharacterized protein n=1 Tax=Paenibacillus taihuensis TaxID=1156355 RepID=A0A3D9RQB5_9BACL|nr:hypothetical protein [Paenibacillus taihuensis]REE78933.1 hypothetical protein A8990_12361 [Paenibacillus taihuensis]